LPKFVHGLIGALALVLMSGTAHARGGVTGSLHLHDPSHVQPVSKEKMLIRRRRGIPRRPQISQPGPLSSKP